MPRPIVQPEKTPAEQKLYLESLRKLERKTGKKIVKPIPVCAGPK